MVRNNDTQARQTGCSFPLSESGPGTNKRGEFSTAWFEIWLMESACSPDSVEVCI